MFVCCTCFQKKYNNWIGSLANLGFSVFYSFLNLTRPLSITSTLVVNWLAKLGITLLTPRCARIARGVSERCCLILWMSAVFGMFTLNREQNDRRSPSSKPTSGQLRQGSALLSIGYINRSKIIHNIL